jgi:hypothetical protein
VLAEQAGERDRSSNPVRTHIGHKTAKRFSRQSILAAIAFAAIFAALAIADYQDSFWFSLQYPRPFYLVWLVATVGTIAYLPRAKRIGILVPTVVFLVASLITLLAHFFII